MALLDQILGVMGVPDPQQRLAMSLGQGPGQPGGAPSPLPGAQMPPQPAPGGGAPPGPPAAGGPPAGPPGAAAGPPPAPPQPQAYTSPPDLVSMYMQLAQRQQASEQFNRGLGLLAASAYPGRRPDIIMNAMTGMTQDPGALIGNIMKLQQFSYLQQQQAAFQRSVPALAQQLNLTPDEIMARGPEALQSVIAAQAPTEAMKNFIQARNAMRQQGMSEDQINQIMPPEMVALGGVSDPTYREFVLGRARNPGDPAYADFPTYLAAKGAKAKLAGEQATDLNQAQAGFASAHEDYGKVENLLTQLNANPDAAVAAVRSLGPTTGKGGVFREYLPSALGGMSTDVATAAGNITQLQNLLYSEGWKGRGNRLSQQEASRLADAWTQLSNPALSPDAIKGQLSSLLQQTQTSHANIFGAAGQPTPQKYWGLMNPIYKPRQPSIPGSGDRFAGASPLPESGGGGGAVGAPGGASGAGPSTSAGVGGTPGAPNLKPLDENARATAQSLIARDGRDAVISHLRARGYDTSGL